MPHDDPLVDAREVAKRLGVHPQSVKRWRHKHQGPAYERISPRLFRYRLSEIERYRREQAGDGGHDGP